MLCTSGEASFLLVSNIPAQFHSSHLREYFSQLIEKKGFVCFHYRHRPEYVEGQHGGSARDIGHVAPAPKVAKTSCCVVAVRKVFEAEFFRLYQGKNWIGPSEKMLSTTVKIRRVVVESSKAQGAQLGGWWRVEKIKKRGTYDFPVNSRFS